MNSATRFSISTAAMLLLAGLASAQGFDDEIMRQFGQFEISDGQTKTLAYGKHDRMYRICVHQSAHAIPLKVMHDNLQSMIYPGDCADVEGMRIQIAPGAKLGEEMTLFGRYHHLLEDQTS